MIFEEGYLYHIYNQGNNRQQVFFSQENYYYFLRKLKIYITPYADIIAWCLMPNHFHLMVRVNHVIRGEAEAIRGATQSRTPNELPEPSFNHAIGRMLSSYTRAINKEKGLSGSLFRKRTKAEAINKPNGIRPSFIKQNGAIKIKVSNPEKEYPQICFNYLHQNPVKAHLAKLETDWAFSSAQDYANLRQGKLVDKLVAKKYVAYSGRDLESHPE